METRILSAKHTEIIIRALHGKVPEWCSGALVMHEALGSDTNMATMTDPIKCLSLHETGFQSVKSMALHEEYSWYVKHSRLSKPNALSMGLQYRPGLWVTRVSTDEPGFEKDNQCVRLDDRKAYVKVAGGRSFLARAEDAPDNHVTQMIYASVSAALVLRYDWTVRLALDGKPGLSFACSPSSARAAYRLRDLHPGKSRRDALLHWVSAHRRNDDIEVSEHLRGKVSFSWRGISCEVIPSAFDREKEISRKASAR